MNLLDNYIKETNTSAKTSALIKNIKNDKEWYAKKNDKSENILMLAMNHYPEIIEKLLNTKEGKMILKDKNIKDEGLLNYFLEVLKKNEQLTIFDHKYIDKLLSTPFNSKLSYLSSFNSKKEVYLKDGKIENLLSYLTKKNNPSFILGSEEELNKEVKKDLYILNSEDIVDLKKIEKYSLVFSKITNKDFVETVNNYSKETQAFIVLYLALQNDRKYLNLNINDMWKPETMMLESHVLNTGDVKMIMSIFEKNEITQNIKKSDIKRKVSF